VARGAGGGVNTTEGAENRNPGSTAPLWAGAAVVAVAPFFAAFRSGGYYPETQLLIGIVAFVSLAVIAIAARWPPLPSGLPLAALAALVGYGVWTCLSTGWARVLEYAVHDVGRVASYAAVFALALAVMRDPRVRRLAPEALLAGIVVVCLYSLAGRLLPHVLQQDVNSVRLSQPLTYWNALGMFAGFGLLLGVTAAGDRTRPLLWRSLACAAAVPCGVTAYLTLSRGVVASVIAGLALCVAVRPGRATLVAAACAMVPVIALALLLNAFPDVVSAYSDAASRDSQASQGAVFLPILVCATAATGFAFARFTRSSLARGPSPLGPRGRARIAIAVVPLVLAVAVGIAGHGTEKNRLPSSASRITSIETARGHYWRVALGSFGRHPVNGVGSGSFTAEWRQRRGGDQVALDAHSLYVETLAELGVVGALLLLAFVTTVVVAVVRAVRATPRNPTVTAAAAVLGAFAVHLALDWDWEMPAVSLVPLILAAAVLQRRPAA
jgi:O-Antigen ligase